MAADEVLRKSPLDAQHREHDARMAPFAGYEMPIQYAGIVAEVTAVRERAGLFDGAQSRSPPTGAMRSRAPAR